jgi:hypothetical protein
MPHTPAATDPFKHRVTHTFTAPATVVSLPKPVPTFAAAAVAAAAVAAMTKPTPKPTVKANVDFTEACAHEKCKNRDTCLRVHGTICARQARYWQTINHFGPKICVHNLRGACNKGYMCTYRHFFTELSPVVG